MDIQSITEKIEKKKARIEQLKTEVKALEEKRTQLENEHIVKLVRQENITLAELDEFLKSAKKGRLTYYGKDSTGTNKYHSEYQGVNTYSGHSFGSNQAAENQSHL